MKRSDAWEEGYWVGFRKEIKPSPYEIGTVEEDDYYGGMNVGHSDRMAEQNGRANESDEN